MISGQKVSDAVKVTESLNLSAKPFMKKQEATEKIYIYNAIDTINEVSDLEDIRDYLNEKINEKCYEIKSNSDVSDRNLEDKFQLAKGA